MQCKRPGVALERAFVYVLMCWLIIAFLASDTSGARTLKGAAMEACGSGRRGELR
jgi:hypothetical protein